MIDLDKASKALRSYLYNQNLIDKETSIFMDEKKNDLYLMSTINDLENDQLIGGYYSYKGRLIIDLYSNIISMRSIIINSREYYKNHFDNLDNYIDKHCEIVGRLNIRVHQYVLYYYKNEIDMGVEIDYMISKERLAVVIFKNNIKYAKKEVRDFFSERYFKEVSNKSLHKMTKKERELVSMIYS